MVKVACCFSPCCLFESLLPFFSIHKNSRLFLEQLLLFNRFTDVRVVHSCLEGVKIRLLGGDRLFWEAFVVLSLFSCGESRHGCGLRAWNGGGAKAASKIKQPVGTSA